MVVHFKLNLKTKILQKNKKNSVKLSKSGWDIWKKSEAEWWQERGRERKWERVRGWREKEREERDRDRMRETENQNKIIILKSKPIVSKNCQG